MMTVSELISKTNADDVWAEYKKHYEEAHSVIISDVFQKLKEMHPAPDCCNMVLYVQAIKENESGDDVVADVFDCDDRSVFFDVWGRADDYDGVYSIASSTYEDLLGYYVSDDTVARFSPAQIMAHILWALDW